jgi:hypothetical protein
MKVRSWLVTGVAVVATGALFLARPDISQGAGGGVGTVPANPAFSFSFASSAAGRLSSRLLDGAAVDLVSQAETHVGIGGAFCKVEVTFTDAQGTVLHTEGVSLGPGEIRGVQLPAGEPEGLAFRVTIQVLDTDRLGRVVPCLAIPSVRMFDRESAKTELYVPVQTN